jgi:hypothetical protein
MPARILCLWLFAVIQLPPSRAAPDSAVAVVQGAEWNAGDLARDGAGEFAVFLRVAQLQREHRAVALIAICDRHGLLRSGGERALRRVVFDGVVVAKFTAEAGSLRGDGVFLDPLKLRIDAARSVIAECLSRHGPPPAAADPENPTSAERAALTAHLRPFQNALDKAADQAARIAMQ